VKRIKWITRVGPGFVIAAVVLGPGSLTAATRLGAAYGNALLWLPLLAGAMMAGFVVLFMRFGIASDRSFLSHAAALWGRPFAVVAGLAMFFVVTAFQFGNNIGVATGVDSLLFAPGSRPPVPPWVWILIFNGLALTFLFAFKRIYAIVEKTMTALVVVMVIVFFANLYFARPSPAGVARGLVPTIPAGLNWVWAAGLVATTFSIVGAIFQTYLVREREWTGADYRRGVADSVSGIAILTLVSMVILVTSAAVFTPADQVRSAADMGRQLERMFGDVSRVIFSVGFVCAAFSSFLVNAMIGGTLLCDGLGRGDDLNSRPVKAGSALSLVLGMILALLVAWAKRVSFTDALLIGEAGSLLAVPLAIIAALLALLWPRRSGARPLGPAWRLFVLAGIGLLLAAFVVSAPHTLQKIRHMFGG
jgi:Mn2+/Fe2+ NRAMP family transporter